MNCKENCLHCTDKCNTKSNTNQHGNSELKEDEIIKAMGDYKNSNIIQTEKGVISIGDILDLINRQKAEIISRTEEYNDMLEQRNKVEEALELKIMDVNSLTSERDALEEMVAEQKAEVERLKKAIKVQDIMIEQQDYKLKSAKSEAIKEFAERVYRFICHWRNWNKLKVSWLFNGECEWLKKSLDNLVKEMTE